MKNLISISIGLAALALAIGYAFSSLWGGAAVIIVLGLLWGVDQRRGWDTLTNLAVVGFMGAAVYGVWQEAWPGWMLLGLAATLVAWDLAHFARRLRQAKLIIGEADLRRAHLQRLLAVAGLGLLLAGIALSFQIELNLGWAILLAGLLIVGLSRIIGQLRQESD